MIKEELKVTIAQFEDQSENGNIEAQFEEHNGIRYKNPEKQLENFFKALSVAKDDSSNFLILPELFLPTKYVYKYISKCSEKNQLVIITGTEWNIHKKLHGKKYILNNAYVSIPNSLKSSSHQLNQSAHVIRLAKLYPAEMEEEYLREKGYFFEKGNKVYLFKSKYLGNWAVLICIDYLNLPIQALLQARIQNLFIIAYNRDIEYYFSLSDSLHRILFCNVILCNTGIFGGSHVFSPFRSSYKRNVYQTKGNNVNSSVSISLPLAELKNEQERREVSNKDTKFIKKSPDFGKISSFKFYDN